MRPAADLGAFHSRIGLQRPGQLAAPNLPLALARDVHEPVEQRGVVAPLEAPEQPAVVRAVRRRRARRVARLRPQRTRTLSEPNEGLGF